MAHSSVEQSFRIVLTGDFSGLSWTHAGFSQLLISFWWLLMDDDGGWPCVSQHPAGQPRFTYTAALERTQDSEQMHERT